MRARGWLLLGFLAASGVAFGQAADEGGTPSAAALCAAIQSSCSQITLTGPSTALRFVATATSGNTAFQMETGARFIGNGATATATISYSGSEWDLTGGGWDATLLRNSAGGLTIGGDGAGDSAGSDSVIVRRSTGFTNDDARLLSLRNGNSSANTTFSVWAETGSVGMLGLASPLACNSNDVTNSTGHKGLIQFDSDDAVWVGCNGTTNLRFAQHIAPVSLTHDFADTTFGQCATDATVTVTGAADGNRVKLGIPNAAAVAGAMYTAWVSAADTVSVRMCCVDDNTNCNPGSGAFSVAVEK